jgi:hypothetical protein
MQGGGLALGMSPYALSTSPRARPAREGGLRFRSRRFQPAVLSRARGRSSPLAKAFGLQPSAFSLLSLRVSELDRHLQVGVQAAHHGAGAGDLLEPRSVLGSHLARHIENQDELADSPRRRRHSLLDRRASVAEGKPFSLRHERHGGERARGERRTHEIRGREARPGSAVVLGRDRIDDGPRRTVGESARKALKADGHGNAGHDFFGPPLDEPRA